MRGSWATAGGGEIRRQLLGQRRDRLLGLEPLLRLLQPRRGRVRRRAREAAKRSYRAGNVILAQGCLGGTNGTIDRARGGARPVGAADDDQGAQLRENGVAEARLRAGRGGRGAQNRGRNFVG